MITKPNVLSDTILQNKSCSFDGYHWDRNKLVANKPWETQTTKQQHIHASACIRTFETSVPFKTILKTIAYQKIRRVEHGEAFGKPETHRVGVHGLQTRVSRTNGSAGSSRPDYNGCVPQCADFRTFRPKLFRICRLGDATAFCRRRGSASRPTIPETVAAHARFSIALCGSRG